MSANNQTLIKKHKDKYYVFSNVNAESWCYYDHKTKTFDESRENELILRDYEFASESLEEAVEVAKKIEEDFNTEYDIILDVLAKDRAEVKIIN